MGFGLLSGGLRLAGLAAVALAGMPPAHHLGRARYIGGRPNRGNFHPKRNRNTGKPHEHAREIARAQRQAERVAANRLDRAERQVARDGWFGEFYELEPGDGLSRRGRRVAL